MQRRLGIPERHCGEQLAPIGRQRFDDVQGQVEDSLKQNKPPAFALGGPAAEGGNTERTDCKNPM